MVGELLSPAGDFETALAAFAAGADAVYCGLNDFSARAFAKNFSFEELGNLLAYARKNVKKVYVTFNTLLDEDQFDGAIETLAMLEEAGPDGVIVQDLGVAKLIRDHFPALTLHASTQLVAHNLEGVLALRDLGFKRVVLARELSLEEITSIAKRCGDVELEVFIHGALCYSISGLCLFGAMEKGRSGNRGRCPYCCREGVSHYPFSMKDLRLGEDVRKLVEAGVASLKIEGRMKSPLYVASVTKYYRQILDKGSNRHAVTQADLETVFSRRTTELYFHGRSSSSPIDSESLGHLGTLIGTVKKVTRDREGLFWLRFHTSRGLEKHDGLQFEAVDENGKHLGMGVVEMRQAISRRSVFKVNAGVDVEVLLAEEMAQALKPDMKIYCSMSNAVKRMFPTPSFRPGDYEGGKVIDVEVRIGSGGLEGLGGLGGLGGCGGAGRAALPTGDVTVGRVVGPSDPLGRVGLVGPSDPLGRVGLGVKVEWRCELEPAKNPEKTVEGVRKAFSKLGGTRYRLGKLTVKDPEKLFVPMSVLNDLRRDLVEKLDETLEKARREKIERAEVVRELPEFHEMVPLKRVKVRAGQSVPPGEWDEVIVAINALNSGDSWPTDIRLALPVYTAEPEFNRLRVTVKGFLRKGFTKWEASDLATLRMLKSLGVEDITADWTLYAFNSRSLATLAEMGVRRFVASPENSRENLQYLAESGFDIEFLVQQSTPLFISLTRPVGAIADGLAVFERDGLWVTTKCVPRTFALPDGVSARTDLSWEEA